VTLMQLSRLEQSVEDFITLVFTRTALCTGVVSLEMLFARGNVQC
jgi:hypothetical protein